MVKIALVAVFSSSSPEPLVGNSSLTCHVMADDRICVTVCHLLLFLLAGGKNEKSSNVRRLQTAVIKVDQSNLIIACIYLTYPQISLRFNLST